MTIDLPDSDKFPSCTLLISICIPPTAIKVIAGKSNQDISTVILDSKMNARLYSAVAMDRITHVPYLSMMNPNNNEVRFRNAVAKVKTKSNIFIIVGQDFSCCKPVTF